MMLAAPGPVYLLCFICNYNFPTYTLSHSLLLAQQPRVDFVCDFESEQ